MLIGLANLLISIENNLQALLNESSITNSEVPENQINTENPSGNSAFKESAQHIHTNIDTFKSKAESDDMLLVLFLKIAKLEVKLDARKSHVTCEISVLTNKLGSFLLDLPKTLKTLDQRDVRNSKLLPENFQFHRKDISACLTCSRANVHCVLTC